MAPRFLQNLLLTNEQRQNARPLFASLRCLTLIQWAQLFVGYVMIVIPLHAKFVSNFDEISGGWRGLAML